ncbi:MAG: hypothetical protein A2Z97_12405 [Bdellovibrionales bacterium GWB1_52_6]|nr:MAG: hypothetical protein A2Z97_12405 [Bdellovibrionales bacterium GWB1_52_6]
MLLLSSFAAEGAIDDPHSCLSKFQDLKVTGSWVGCNTRLSCDNRTLKAQALSKHIGIYRLKSTCKLGTLPEQVEVQFEPNVHTVDVASCHEEVELNGHLRVSSNQKALVNAPFINHGFIAIDNPWATSHLRAVSWKYSSLFGKLILRVRTCSNSMAQVFSDCGFSLSNKIAEITFDEDRLRIEIYENLDFRLGAYVPSDAADCWYEKVGSHKFLEFSTTGKEMI